MSTNPFQKATRAQLKARVAFAGPTGAGKTWTALEWATVLANGAPIAFVDTERGSASLYSDHFTFDVMAFDPPYDPQRLTDILKVAEAHGYAVVVIDSMSHFWEGEGGTRDIADAAAARSGGNSFAGWKDATPKLRHLIDVMLGLDAHVVATMRSKMEYVIEQNERGKSAPRKVGLAPVMRAGVEYEFTLVGDIDLDHRIAITKSRCDRLADELILPGRAADAAQLFADWLAEGKPVAPRHVVDGLVSRMNALHPEDRRKACKGEFVAAFGRPADLAAADVAEAEALVARFEGSLPAVPIPTASAWAGGGNDKGTDDGALTGVGDAQATPTVPEAEIVTGGGLESAAPDRGDGAALPPTAPSGDTSAPDRQAPSTPQEVEPAPTQGEVGTAPAGGVSPPPGGDDAPVPLKVINERGYQAINRKCRAIHAEHGDPDKDTAKAQWEALAWACSGARTTHLGELTPDEASVFRTRMVDVSEGRAVWAETSDPQWLGWTLTYGEETAA